MKPKYEYAIKLPSGELLTQNGKVVTSDIDTALSQAKALGGTIEPYFREGASYQESICGPLAETFLNPLNTNKSDTI